MVLLIIIPTFYGYFIGGIPYSPAPYPPPVNASGIEQPTAGDGQLLEGLHAAALDHPLGVHGANPHGHQHRDVVDLVGSIPGQET